VQDEYFTFGNIKEIRFFQEGSFRQATVLKKLAPDLVPV